MDTIDTKHLPKDNLPNVNRQSLLMKQSELKNELDLQFADIKEDAADIGKKALIVGGTLFVAYKMVKWATKDSSTKKKNKFGQPILEEKRKVESKGIGAPLVYKKEQKVGLTFGQMVKQQLMTVGGLILASQFKSMLRKHNIIQD